MTDIININSNFQFGPRQELPAESQFAIKNEPMLFNCDFSHALEMGGRLTREFLGRLPVAWQQDMTVIDSRVHMLMPGWYPCIPGWHHDDVIRNREDGQPNYLQTEYRSEHIMALWNADICPTLFAPGDQRFVIPPIGKVIYEIWHDVMEKKVADNQILTYKAPDRTLIYFNDRTWHRGTAAIANGFRFFIRASRYYRLHEGHKLGDITQVITRGNERTNEIRRQSQVYMSAENAGW